MYSLGSTLLLILAWSIQERQCSWFASSFSVGPTPFGGRPRISNDLAERYMSTTFTNDDVATNKRSRFNRLIRRPRKENNKKDSSSSGVQNIKFTGTKQVKTDPAAFSNDYALLNEYFSLAEYRSLLFPANNATIMSRTITDDLFATWCSEAEIGGSTGPAVNVSTRNGQRCLELQDTDIENVEIMKINAILNMPSLLIRSESIIGTKLLSGGRDAPNGSFPELQFTLLDSQLHLEGSKAAKFIFNNLIKFRESMSSFTRVTVERESETQIAFTTNARLGINIRIPSAVLKFLPSVNVEKFEEQGSRSIQKLLEKDLEPALLSFRDTYITFADAKREEETILLRP